MTILEPVLDSSNSHCNDIVSKHSGAVANACSRTNMVLTTAPLYELVWSKQKGLSHKSASSSAEKRTSLLRSTETSNIVISSPNCNHEEERNDGRNLCEHKLSSLHSESHIEDNDYKNVTPVGSPQNPCGPENCSATTESSRGKEQMSILEEDNGPNHQTTLECSKEVTEKYNYIAPSLGIVSSSEEPTLAKDIAPINICSGSTSRATRGVFPMDVARRMKFKKVESHHRNWVRTFGSTFNYNKKASEMRKDKQPIIHDVDDGSSSSNRREDGHANFECISSRGVISTVKRARICDSESKEFIGGKKMKWQSNGDYSFMNWVSAITNGLTKPSKDVPRKFFQHPSLQVNGIIPPLSVSDGRREVGGVSQSISGFKSMFQDLYCSGYNVSSNKNKFIDNQKELVALKETEGKKQDSCAEMMRQNRDIFPKSSWIMRYTHGLSSPSTVSVERSEHRHPYLEAQTNRCEKPQHNSISHTEKPESILQLTLPSKYCKRSESMSSSFGKRLDSLLHATALKDDDEYTGANKICLFCGMSDHSIRECTKVVEARLEHYLKTNPLYDKIKRASCFCILCFHLDHWAASCPNVSSKGNQVLCDDNGFDDANFRNSPEKHQNYHLADHDGAIMLWSGRKNQLENRSKDSNFVVSRNIRRHKKKSEYCHTLDLHMNRVEDATNIDKMKVTAVFSSQNEAKRSDFTPFSSHLSTKIASEREAIFVFVRKLRLSRTDITRWMKSSIHINITGFFLRLRIGKLEKDLGGTSYHVACINGASSLRTIFVRVGSSTYSVTNRFISNQDFNEDELNTWWFQNMRDDSKMPSREELNEKLQLRKKFAF